MAAQKRDDKPPYEEEEPPIELREPPPDIANPPRIAPKAPKGEPLRQGQRLPEKKPLPASLDAEKAVLCSIMLDPQRSMPAVAHKLQENHFHHPAHREIYRAFDDIQFSGRKIDLITVTNELRDCNLLDQVGGPSYIAEIATFITTSHNIDEYIGILREKYAARQIHQLGLRMVEKSLESQSDLSSLLAESSSVLKEIDPSSSGSVLTPRSVMEFMPAPPDESILGNRWLCRGGAALIIGSSGIGKSSSSMQQDLLWSCGKEAFGIKPAKALKVLTIQAENNDGDMYEMREGVLRGLELNDEERKLVEANALFWFEQSRTGINFVEKVLRPLLKTVRPDLVRIDPLSAYAGADLTNASESAELLRNAINPVLTEYQCGLVLVHHTPKTTSRDTTEWKPSDWMYSGAGSADIVNWARAILLINHSHEVGKFQFMAAKRAGRIGWCNEDGEKEFARWYQWAPEGYHWIPSDAPADKIKEKKSGQYENKYSKEDILDLLLEGKISRKPAELQQLCKQQAGISSSTFWRLWKELKGSPFIVKDDGGRFVHINCLNK